RGRRIGQNDCYELKGAALVVAERLVLADPSEPGARGELALRYLPRVHVAPGLRARGAVADRGGELLQTTAQDGVIVRGPRVLGDLALIPGRRPRVRRPVEVIREGDHRDASVRHDPR